MPKIPLEDPTIPLDVPHDAPAQTAKNLVEHGALARLGVALELAIVLPALGTILAILGAKNLRLPRILAM